MRVFERENFQLFIGIVGLLFALAFFSSTQANASSDIPLKCQTAFEEKVFTIEAQTIAFHARGMRGRSISSVMNVSTKKTYKGFRKTVYINGNKHVIFVKDIQHPSDKTDYLAVTSEQGHKMTYPLTCSK